MYVCKEHEFYNGICPALNDKCCNSKFPCGNQITLKEYEIKRTEFLKAKTLIESCGYKVIKINTLSKE